MKKETKIIFRPSIRSGHPLTEEDRWEITKNYLVGIKALGGYERIDILDDKGNVIETV